MQSPDSPPGGEAVPAAEPRSKWHSQRKWDAAHPRARLVHRITNEAIKRGLLIVERCEEPGCNAIGEAHHESYEEGRELDVRWRCRRHHQQLHADMRKAARQAREQSK